jgi:PIN domain nuclease of toxin-antitoxin system
MKVLLDTHAFLWYLTADPNLSSTAHTLMTDPQNELFLSMASHWEMGIKVSIGKLAIPGPFADVIPQQQRNTGIHLLPIQPEHVEQVVTLPFHHKDPFDRMLVAQAVVESLPLLSADVIFDQYLIRRLW